MRKVSRLKWVAEVIGVKGEPPTGSTKVCINTLYGFKNSITVILTGLDIERKAEVVEEIVFGVMGGKRQFARTDVKLTKYCNPDPVMNDEAFSYLRISVMDKDKTKVGKLFSSAMVEAALSTIPGFTLTGPPSKEVPAILHWPALVSLNNVRHQVVLNDEVQDLEMKTPAPLVALTTPTPAGTMAGIMSHDSTSLSGNAHLKIDPAISGVNGSLYTEPFIKIPFGRLFATRSGDKGGP